MFRDHAATKITENQHITSKYCCAVSPGVISGDVAESEGARGDVDVEFDAEVSG